ncbi:putative 60S ribosomal protein L24 [Panicum miliaceum]|uniref:60S ribosomal protein L24 n=1 Tax=Panicum miliaceum TaxID=4540 RepID=A0A3L6S2P3_PANMI|nr:putative 60S ribosomal protein L24 [Panicum miliaceum]
MRHLLSPSRFSLHPLVQPAVHRLSPASASTRPPPLALWPPPPPRSRHNCPGLPHPPPCLWRRNSCATRAPPSATIIAHAHVFLLNNSKCKRYFHNCLKLAKLTWTGMYRK